MRMCLKLSQSCFVAIHNDRNPKPCVSIELDFAGRTPHKTIHPYLATTALRYDECVASFHLTKISEGNLNTRTNLIDVAILISGSRYQRSYPIM